MKEIIYRLEGISALLYALSQIDENSTVEGLDSACFIINGELQKCIEELKELQEEEKC